MKAAIITVLGVIFAAVAPALWVAWSSKAFIIIIVMGMLSLVLLNLLDERAGSDEAEKSDDSTDLAA